MGIVKNVKVKVISDGELKQLSVILKAIPKPAVFNDAKDCKALSEANKQLFDAMNNLVAVKHGIVR